MGVVLRKPSSKRAMTPVQTSLLSACLHRGVRGPRPSRVESATTAPRCDSTSATGGAEHRRADQWPKRCASTCPLTCQRPRSTSNSPCRASRSCRWTASVKSRPPALPLRPSSWKHRVQPVYLSKTVMLSRPCAVAGVQAHRSRSRPHRCLKVNSRAIACPHLLREAHLVCRMTGLRIDFVGQTLKVLFYSIGPSRLLLLLVTTRALKASLSKSTVDSRPSKTVFKTQTSSSQVHICQISTSHLEMMCRGVATAMQHLEVERQTITQCASRAFVPVPPPPSHGIARLYL